MVCPQKLQRTLDKSLVQIAPKPLTFVEKRKAICESMEDCRDGDTCLPTEAKHPGHSSIAEGVQRPELECPLGHWTRQPVRCPSCDRMAILTIHAQECIYCRNKKQLKRQRLRVNTPGVSGATDCGC